MRSKTPALLASLLAAFLFGTAASAQTLVDVVNDATDPTHRTDSEPSIAVNPLNSNEISIIAFPNSWSATTNAPIFKSRDGGATWTPILQLPTGGASSTRSLDQKIAYTADGKLIVSQIPDGVGLPDCVIYRQTAADPDAPLALGMFYGDDQPHIASDNAPASPFFNRRYSPWLNTGLANWQSQVVWTIDDGANVNNVPAGDNSTFNNRTTRITVGPEGSVYIVYKTREGAVDANFETAHFNVRRSDDGGVTWTANGGGATGVSVTGATAVTTWFTNSFGNIAKGKVGRARSSDAWIATNPANGDVWVAYCNRDASTFGQIFVARSHDRGQTWDAPQRVTDGTHNSAYPEVAVTSSGVVGVLYVDYDDSGANISFRHRFAQSSNGGSSWNDVVLQAFDPTPLANAVAGFLWGDYEGLTAAGHTFYGVFTGASIGRAAPEMDPIFFKVSATPPVKDFYVRDWTDSAVSADNGAEPSTHAAFYVDSDVWNLRTNVAPTFNASDQPVHETPNNGGVPPNNFMFARVHRNVSGAAQDVRARYMYSEFGTGSNYQVAGAAGPDTISFGAADSSVVSPAHPWNLPMTVSNHLCLLVEIDTDDDPIQPPSLLGSAPGWPTSDLNVLNDNNKAQRNTEVNHETGESASTNQYFAIVHNPGTTIHDFTLDFHAIDGDATIAVVNGNERASGRKGTLKIAAVRPGENRWVSVRLDHTAGNATGIQVAQIESGKPVNGFEIRVEPAPLPDLIVEKLDARRIFFQRLGAATYAKRVAALARHRPTPDQYVAIVAEGSRVIGELRPELRRQILDSAFAAGEALAKLDGAVKTRVASDVVVADGEFLQRADASLTKVQKDRGDRADIQQMIAWERELARGKLAKCGSLDLDSGRYGLIVRSLARCAGVSLSLGSSPSQEELQRAHREILSGVSGY